jgi:hypothetical protein
MEIHIKAMYDYNVIMYIARHISLIDGDDLDEMKKIKMVVDFLEKNKMKTNATYFGS